jgi:dTDP-4-amino-4,6-dideoxygalactose transaminase
MRLNGLRVEILNKINITKPFLPPLKDLNCLLESIWESKILSNNGKFERLLEEKLCSFLKLDNLSVFNNGTTALIAGIKALDLKGEVITTPFTFELFE